MQHMQFKNIDAIAEVWLFLLYRKFYSVDIIQKPRCCCGCVLITNIQRLKYSDYIFYDIILWVWFENGMAGSIVYISTTWLSMAEGSPISDCFVYR